MLKVLHLQQEGCEASLAGACLSSYMCLIQRWEPEIIILKVKQKLGKICCNSDWQCLMIKNMIHSKATHAFQSVPRALAPTKFWVPKRQFCLVTAGSIQIGAVPFPLLTRGVFHEGDPKCRGYHLQGKSGMQKPFPSSMPQDSGTKGLQLFPKSVFSLGLLLISD